ncbi:ATP-binding protein [Chloroflexi bacterium TSY]|nr:ATP-binding protein [Chloroflexi bacterium TSY]
MSNNPFTIDLPIQDPETFFGRKEMIRQIIGRLRNRQDSSVIGERRIGKTSLLYHLQNPNVLQQYGLDPNEYLFVYFSFKNANGIENANELTPSSFWHRLLQSIAEQISDPEILEEIEELMEENNMKVLYLQDLFADIYVNTNRRVVLLLDEFGRVAQAPELDADFFANLRILATGDYISLIFVTSSRLKLSKLAHSEEVAGSPFFNIFELFYLKPFQQDSAEKTIKALLAETDVEFNEQEMSYIMALSGRHPFFLQMGANYLFDAYTVAGLRGDPLLPARLERVENEFMEQAHNHFAHYWQQSTDEERLFLTALAGLLQVNDASATIGLTEIEQFFPGAGSTAQVIQDRGLVMKKEGGLQLFSPAYSRWIVQEVSHDRVGFDVLSVPDEVVNIVKEAGKKIAERPLWLTFVGS